MALSEIVRSRIQLDLLKDGVVANEANYDASLIDYAAAPTALKYVDAAIRVHDGQSAAQVAAMSNAEKGRRYQNILRRLHRQWLIDVKTLDARATEIVTATAEADTDVGIDE